MQCKACANAKRRKLSPEENLRNNLMRFYGITPEEYDAMLAAQDGVCAICRRPESTIDYRSKKPQRLAVDHCHVTKAIRGLLCANCNRGLGGLKHDQDVLRAAIRYLDRTE